MFSDIVGGRVEGVPEPETAVRGGGGSQSPKGVARKVLLAQKNLPTRVRLPARARLPAQARIRL